MKALFISYTGLHEPLGQSQVLPYVLGLARRGHQMSLLSFERSSQEEGPAWIGQQLAQSGVNWLALRYHRRPPVISTAWDILVALRIALRAAREGTQLVHARSHVPCLVADLSFRLAGTPYLFDHRGLMAEEYADAGIWPRGGILYTLTNRLERRFVSRAHSVVVLTSRLREEIDPPTKSTVIPCCVDLSTFRPRESGVTPGFDLVYAGSWTGLYRQDMVLAFFDHYRSIRPGARLLLLVPPDADVPRVEGLDIKHLQPSDVPAFLRQARAGISFRRSGRAEIAASPVKVSEYLATGLPVVSNRGVGDLDVLFEVSKTGVSVESASAADLRAGAERLAALLDDREVGLRCRKLAEENFDLEVAIARYDRIYRGLEGAGEE